MSPEQIRLWRWEHEVSQQWLADHLHVHVLTIKRWESGDRTAPEYLRLALERLEQLLAGERLEEVTP